MKKCLAALIALGLVFTGLPLIGDGNGLETTVSAASVIPSPTGIKKKATDSTVTISWDQVDGASFYNVFLYYDDSDEYEYLMSVSGTKITFPVMPMRDYSFKLSTVKTTGNGMEESDMTRSFNVRSKGHWKLKFPDTKKAGLPELSLNTASAVAEMFPGAFGSEFSYENDDEYEAVMKKIGTYRKKCEKTGYVFAEESEKEEENFTSYESSFSLDGINVGVFSIFVYEDRVIMMIVPYDYVRWAAPLL